MNSPNNQIPHPPIYHIDNGFGKAMEASVEAVDAVEADDPQGPRDGLRRVPVATDLTIGAGEMQCVALALGPHYSLERCTFPSRGILTG